MVSPIIRSLSFFGYMTSSSYVSFNLIAGGIPPQTAIPSGFLISVVIWPIMDGYLLFDLFKS